MRFAFAALTEPPLTTVCLPRMELGRRAVEALMTTIEHPDQRGVEINIPTYLIIRGSTAPAPSTAPDAHSARRGAGAGVGRGEDEQRAGDVRGKAKRKAGGRRESAGKGRAR